MRYFAEREIGNDWAVVDSKMKLLKYIATGLDREEAETLANQRNADEQKEKQLFS